MPIDPTYNGRKVPHDFAVLTLATAPQAAADPPATPAESKAATRPGRIVRSGGWGTRSAWGFNVARRLKTTKERIFPARMCDLAYGKSRGFQQASMICALGKLIRRIHSRLPYRPTSCEGDSGGPLVADTADGPRLIGAVSSGPFPCGLGGASIYARVADRLAFIESSDRLAGPDPCSRRRSRGRAADVGDRAVGRRKSEISCSADGAPRGAPCGSSPPRFGVLVSGGGGTPIVVGRRARVWTHRADVAVDRPPSR